MFVVPFRAEHVFDLEEIQVVQTPDFVLGTEWEPTAMMELEQKGMGYTLFDGAAAVVCAGVFSIWPQRAHAWMLAVSGWGSRVDLREGLRLAKSILESYPARRIETTVLADWAPGHVLVRHLGFELEAERLRCYDPEGRDFSLYARIRA